MKFSIIICTYNSEKFLTKNIASIKKQSCLDFECVFIDGFSKDKTVEIIEAYKKEMGDKIKFVQTDPKGISNAMNEGIKQASGDYVIHLHSDDSFFDSKVLEDVSNFLIGKDLDWIYGKISVVEENGKAIGLFPRRKLWQLGDSILGKNLLKFFNFIPHQAVFIKRDVFTRFGYFDETISSAMDPDLWLRIKNKTKWSFFDRIVSNYCVHSGAESSNLKNKEKNRKNYLLVQRRYLSWLEIVIAQIVNFLIERGNKNLR